MLKLLSNVFYNPYVTSILTLEDDAYFPDWNQEKWNETEQWFKTAAFLFLQY